MAPHPLWDLALNDIESFDMTLDTPVTAFGIDFVDPDGDGTPFEAILCSAPFATTPPAGMLSPSCPPDDVVAIVRFQALGTQRSFIGFDSQQPFEQVSIRDLSGNNANEFFGHFYAR